MRIVLNILLILSAAVFAISTFVVGLSFADQYLYLNISVFYNPMEIFDIGLIWLYASCVSALSFAILSDKCR